MDPGFQFEWDLRKASSNLVKHGVAFNEALTVFYDPLARIFEDTDQSVEEPRELIIGHSAGYQLLVVSFTERQGGIRIISARHATRLERQDYEENQ